jgi:hypothetical protein
MKGVQRWKVVFIEDNFFKKEKKLKKTGVQFFSSLPD